MPRPKKYTKPPKERLRELQRELDALDGSARSYARILTLDVWGWVDRWSRKLEYLQERQYPHASVLVARLVLDDLAKELAKFDEDHEARVVEMWDEVGKLQKKIKRGAK